MAGFADGSQIFLPSKMLHLSHLLLPEDVRGIRRMEQGADFGSAAKPSTAVGTAPLGTGKRGPGLLGSWWFYRKYFFHAKF